MTHIEKSSVDEQEQDELSSTVTTTTTFDSSLQATVQSDLVLSYNWQHKNNKVRLRFEKSLVAIGLIVDPEYVDDMCFSKIKVPMDLLQSIAELIQLQMPMKAKVPEMNSFFATVKTCLGIKFTRRKYSLMLEYNREREYLFDQNSPLYFNAFIRTYIAYYIIDNHRIKTKKEELLSVDTMIVQRNIYTGMFPLHDGLVKTRGSMRNFLYKNWATYWNIFRTQPIDQIKDYFGYEIGMYFALCGFHTWMTCLSISGLIIFFILASIVGYEDFEDKDVSEWEDKYLCPQWESSHLLPVPQMADYNLVGISNVVGLFGIIKCIWSSVYIQLWKRYSVVFEHRWGLLRLPTLPDKVRKEFFKKFGRNRFDTLDVDSPVWRFQVPMAMVALLSIAFSIAIIICEVLAVTALYLIIKPNRDLSTVEIFGYGILEICMYFFGSIALELLFTPLFHWITIIEVHRTTGDHARSLYFKQFIFKMFNHHGFILTNLILKKHFIEVPSFDTSIYSMYTKECLTEYCDFKLILLINFYSILIMMYSFFKRRFRLFFKTRKRKKALQARDARNRFIENFFLLEWEGSEMSSLYMELVLQYSFMMFYVSLLPFFPMLTLIRHLMDVRFNAKALIKYYKKPSPQFATSLGFWLYIIHAVSLISIVINALLMAFFLPIASAITYVLSTGENSVSSYLAFTLSKFPLMKLYNGTLPPHVPQNKVECWYIGFRYPAGHEEEFMVTKRHWTVMVTRMSIMLGVMILVKFVATIISWLLPSIPKAVRENIAKENLQIRECIHNEAMVRKAMQGDKEALKRLGKKKLSFVEYTGRHSIISHRLSSSNQTSNYAFSSQ